MHYKSLWIARHNCIFTISICSEQEQHYMGPVWKNKDHHVFSLQEQMLEVLRKTKNLPITSLLIIFPLTSSNIRMNCLFYQFNKYWQQHQRKSILLLIQEQGKSYLQSRRRFLTKTNSDEIKQNNNKRLTTVPMADGDSAFIQSDIRKILAMFKLYQF